MNYTSSQASTRAGHRLTRRDHLHRSRDRQTERNGPRLGEAGAIYARLRGVEPDTHEKKFCA